MASSAVASLYAGLPIDHVVPEAGDLAKSLTASDILVGRRTVRFQPQTGTQVGSSTVSAAGSIVQFVEPMSAVVKVVAPEVVPTIGFVM